VSRRFELGDGFEVSLLAMAEVDAEGRFTLNVLFDEDDLQSAVEALDHRYLTWSAEPMAPWPALENATTRALARFGELFAARDWDGIADQYPDEVVFDDRRTSVNSGVTTGRDDGVTLVRGLVDVGFVDVDTETLAVRGDRLALVLRRWRRKDGFELPILAVQEHDDRGRQSWVALFDPDDLASAVEALEDRHLALHGANMPHAERQFIENMLQRNRGKEARHLAAGYEMIDHSSSGFGTADEAGHLEQVAAIGQMLSSVVMVVGKIYSSERAVLSRHSLTGRTADGADHRWEMAVVECVVVAGRIVRLESFPVEQWDAAFATFDRWSAGAPRRRLPR
jgi:hypothetical protein